jgi:polynucleotide 5'-kinase involved in rRNA processing
VGTSSVHQDLAAELATAESVLLLGGIDTGKTTLARRIIGAASQQGRTVAYVDADIGNTTVGPPTCVGLRMVRSPTDDHLEQADALHFVGGISPERLVLQQVVATAAVTEQARQQADLVVIDTTGLVSGVGGESLKYHKMEVCRPQRVVALQRGSELEPIVGMLRRFFGADVISVPVEPEVMPAGPDERVGRRALRFKEAFAPPLEKWRVRPTVFAPTLPSGLDLARLDGVLVGVHDDAGRCQGLGRLEHDDGVLRVLTNCGEGMQGLRLGSVRIDLDAYSCQPINLRELMFGL